MQIFTRRWAAMAVIALGTLVSGSLPAPVLAGDAGAAPHLPRAPGAGRAGFDPGALLPLSARPADMAEGTGNNAGPRDWARAPERRLSPYGLPCREELSAVSAPGAMIRLTLFAPCRAGATVRIEHAGLVLEIPTDSMGALRVDLPALVGLGELSAGFEDGTRLARTVVVPDMGEFTRVVVLWGRGAAPGDDGVGEPPLALHAREVARTAAKGADLWHRQPGNSGRLLRGQGGRLTVIDADNGRAEVYTAPRRLGTVRLSLEGEVTQDNCGQAVPATVLRAAPAGGPERSALSLRMPGCARVGEYLRLKSVLPDLKIARN